MRIVIILGSSRKGGETKKVVEELIRISGWDLIDLADYNILHFDYEYKNRNDDYIDLIKKIVDDYDILIFATPVYWYSMSGIMKVFFDRFTDLLTIEKELGRKLRRKKMGVISSSNGDNLGEYFWLPFSKTANYLGMKYLGNVHTITDQDNELKLSEFVKLIEREK